MNASKREISAATRQDRQAQKALFESFSPKMIAIAKSYVGNLHEAEDIVLQAFYTCFTKIDECKDQTKFGGWIRSIVVNEAINVLRKKKNILFVDFDTQLLEEVLDEEEENIPIPIDINQLLERMPDGYRMIFNLYVFEERKHSEIAQLLNITEGTSKSQLNKAKKWIITYLKKDNYVKTLE